MGLTVGGKGIKGKPRCGRQWPPSPVPRLLGLTRPSNQAIYPCSAGSFVIHSAVPNQRMSLDTQTVGEVLQTPGEFPGTVWLDVTDRKKVIHQYWSALRVYLVCLLSRFPDYRNETDDLLQEFILKKIL